MIHACILAKVRLEIGEDSDLTFDSHFTQPSAFPCYAPQKNIKKVKFIQIILCHSSLLDCWRREQKHWGDLSRRGFFGGESHFLPAQFPYSQVALLARFAGTRSPNLTKLQLT